MKPKKNPSRRQASRGRGSRNDRYRFDIKTISSQRQGSITFFPEKGVLVSSPQVGNSVNRSHGERGEIVGWSKSSRRRMRETLLTMNGPEGMKAYGVTLTCPPPKLTAAETKSLWKDFCRELDRAGMSAVWRVEIQRRKELHWHLIVWSPDVVEISFGYGNRYGLNAASAIKHLWHEALTKLGPIKFDQPYFGKDGSWKSGIISGGSRMIMPGAHWYSCNVSDGSGAKGEWLRYIQDHATKAKQEQIPESIGRHWGVVGRKRLVKLEGSSVVNFTDRQFNVFMRALQRLATPMRKAEKNPFGRVLGFRSTRGSMGKSVWFSKVETLEPLAKWVVKNYPEESDPPTVGGPMRETRPRSASVAVCGGRDMGSTLAKAAQNEGRNAPPEPARPERRPAPGGLAPLV